MKSPETKRAGNSSIRTYRFLLLASLSALSVSTLASWFFFSRWEEMSDKYSALLSQQCETSRQVQQLQDELNRIAPDLEVMRDPEYIIFNLEAAEPGKDIHSRVYWNSMTKEALFDALTLPEAENGMQYTIYCMGGGLGKKVKVLPFNINREQLIPLGNVDQANRWWITYGNQEDDGSVIIAESK